MSTLMRQTCQDFEVHIVVDKDLRGISWARNRGAEAANGQYLLFSDNDILWDPDALEVMVQTLERVRHAEKLLDSGWGRTRAPAGASVPAAWRTAYAYGGYDLVKIRRRWLRRVNRQLLDRIGNIDWDFDRLKAANFISPMSLMLRSMFIGFDEDLKRLQDWDLWLRLALERRLKGVWVGRTLFATPYRQGVSFGGGISYEEAHHRVCQKLGLPLA